MATAWTFDFDARVLRVYASEPPEGEGRLFQEFSRMNAPGSEVAGPMSEMEFFAYVAEEVELLCSIHDPILIQLRASAIHRRRLEGLLSPAARAVVASSSDLGGRESA